jgi:hypothetical protein
MQKALHTTIVKTDKEMRCAQLTILKLLSRGIFGLVGTFPTVHVWWLVIVSP